MFICTTKSMSKNLAFHKECENMEIIEVEVDKELDNFKLPLFSNQIFPS